jgi:hypothetical protein
MGAERRRHERFACSIPCELQGEGKPVTGTVRNLSAAGLSVVADLAVEQGDVLHVVLQPPRKPSIEIEAIVWHDNPVRVRSTGKAMHRLGLVLSEAPDCYRELLGRSGQSERSPSQPEPEPEPAPTPASPQPSESPVPRTRAKREARGLPKPTRYRARVKQEIGPRTRSILVFAENEAEARGAALKEVGPGWQLLELERA